MKIVGFTVDHNKIIVKVLIVIKAWSVSVLCKTPPLNSETHSSIHQSYQLSLRCKTTSHYNIFTFFIIIF